MTVISVIHHLRSALLDLEQDALNRLRQLADSVAAGVGSTESGENSMARTRSRYELAGTEGAAEARVPVLPLKTSLQTELLSGRKRLRLKA